MTLPAAPPMTMAQMAAEFGLGVGCVFPRDFYGKGGAPAAGALSFSDFLGRSAVTFDTAPGAYSSGGTDSAEFSITCSVPAVWTWTKSAGPNAGATPASGGTAATWDGTCSSIPGFRFSDPTQPNSTSFTVHATVGGVTYGPWTIDLSCDGGTYPLGGP